MLTRLPGPSLRVACMACGLWLIAAGWVAAELPARSVQPGEAISDVVASVPGPRVAGQVLDARRQPLAGAALELQALADDEGWPLPTKGARSAPARAVAVTTVSDAAGRFALHAPAVGMWQLKASAPGYAAARIDLIPLVHDQALSPIVLRASRTIAVEVVEPSGVPVPRATVVLDARPGGDAAAAIMGPTIIGLTRAWTVPQVASTDTSGRAQLVAPAGGTFSLRVLANGFPPWSGRVRGRPSERVVLRHGVAYDLRVRDLTGRPAAHAIVRQGSTGVPIAHTDDRGFARLFVVPGERHDIHVSAADGRAARVAIEAPPPDRDAAASESVVVVVADVVVADVSVVGAVPAAWGGRVASSRGQVPIAHAVVWRADDPAAFARTDSEGRFRLPPRSRPRGLDDRRPGVDTLRVAAWGYLPVAVPVATASASGRLVLRPAARLRGVVVDAAGRGIPDAVVHAATADDAPVTARSAGDGAFVLPSVPLGRSVQLLARRAGFIPARLEVPLARAGERSESHELRVRLDRGRFGHGMVLDEAEQPVADASITLARSPDGTGARVAGQEPLRALSDNQGRFVLTDIPPGRFDLSARAVRFAPVTVPGITIEGGDAPVDLGTLILGPGVVIAGQVLDTTGQPVANAAIRARSEVALSEEVLSASGDGAAPSVLSAEPPEAWSDADGQFSIGDLAPGQKVTLQVMRQGYATARIEAVRAPANDLEVVLEEAMALRGVVRDELGHPIADAHLHLARESSATAGADTERAGQPAPRPARFATSAPTGSFVIEGIAAGSWTLHARAHGYRDGEPLPVQVSIGEAMAPLSVVLATGASVAGQVVDGDGGPVAEARVSATAASGRAPVRSATTDAEGRYRLDGLPQGKLAFAAEHAEHPRAARELEVQPGDNRLDFAMDRAWTISGLVLDLADQPVAGARVDALPAGAGPSTRARRLGSPSGAGRAVVESGPDGSFEVAIQAEGNYVVRAEKPGYSDHRVEDLVPIHGQSARGVVLRLEPGGVIAGQVLGVTFDELSSVRVVAFPGDRATPPESTTVDFEAHYRFDSLPFGDWVIYAGVGDSGKSVKESVRLAVGESEITQDLQLGAGLVLSGQVMRASLPVARAQVRASGLGSLAGARTVAGQDGRFRLEGLEVGEYQVVVADHADGPGHVREVRLETDQDLLIELEAHTLGGQIVGDQEGNPIPDASVTLVSTDRARSGSPIVRRSDARGAFRFSGLASGRYRVQASKDGYGNSVQEIAVDGRGDGHGIELRLAPSEALTLDVRHPTGGVAREVGVVVLDGHGQPWLSGWFGATQDGLIRLDELPAGRWTLLASGRGTATVRQPVEAPGGPVTVRLPETGALIVRVPELVGTGRLAHLVLSDPAGQPYFDVGQRQRQWQLRDGVVTLPSIPVGTWTVAVRTRDEQAAWTASSQVSPGQATAVDLN